MGAVELNAKKTEHMLVERGKEVNAVSREVGSVLKKRKVSFAPDKGDTVDVAPQGK